MAVIVHPRKFELRIGEDIEIRLPMHIAVRIRADIEKIIKENFDWEKD